MLQLLYTGDFSRQEDRHLMAAEIPSVKPDILIIVCQIMIYSYETQLYMGLWMNCCYFALQESTYGTHIHEKREEREARFCNTVHDIVNREGRCLIPVFALGRAQELLLILGDKSCLSALFITLNICFSTTKITSVSIF